MLLIQHRRSPVLRPNNIFRLATVAVLFVLGLSATLPAQNASDLRLVPFPKQVQIDGEQRFSLKTPLVLHVAAKDRDTLGTTLVDELKRAGFTQIQLVVSDPGVPQRVTLAAAGATFTELILPEQAGEGQSDVAESYALTVSPNGILCWGKGDAGLYYAVQTLRQLIRANADANGTLPCLTIRDWPSMKYRCFQDDWTRGPSPHLETIFGYFDLGSHLKHNMFTYYNENQVEYKKHPKLNPQDGTLSQEELKKAVEYAAKKHLIFLGNQQSFAHHYKIFAVPEYAHLGEAGYILSPVVEEVYQYLDDLYSEILPLVPFEMFNVCCDETWDLGKSGPSKELADEIGVGGVYLKHILRVHELLKKYDKRMMMWGDVLVGAHAHAIDITEENIVDRIPRDVVMMCWDYEPRADFDMFIKPFSDSGFEFFVCPGQSNWSVILPLIHKYTVNIQNFVRDGCKHGAIGMLNTGWEDDGEALHGYTWHAIGWGAECSWNASKTDLADFNRRVGPVLFGAKGDNFGKAIELLAELQASPELGHGYNSRFWERDFLPQQSPDAVERRAKRILELVLPAIKHLEITKEQATVNAELLDSFLFGARRMELIATRMLDGLDLSRRYAAASALDLTDAAQKKLALDELDTMATIIDKNRKTHTAFKTEFVRIWNSESKPFSLDRVTRKYDDLDAWFADIENRIHDVLQKVTEGQIDTLPDIGIGDGVMARKTRPSNVVASPLSPDTPWAISGASFRLGLTVEAGNADRSLLPIELEVSIPELVRGKLARAFLLSADGQNAAILPTQLDPIAGKSTRLLTLIVPELKKEETAMIHVYFGLESAPAEWSAIATWDGDDGMKVIENEFAQIHLGSEGGHAYKWIVKGYDGLDMTDPGNTSYHGFSDHGHADRSKRFELVCMNNGPAMVRYGCYFDGELVKTLTVYAGMPILDVITSYPTGYYWNFDDPDLFAADGKTPGTYLFSNGKTGPTPPKGASNDLQIKESGVFWAIKTNEQGLMHGMTTPEATSRFVIGPGGNMGGIGIESGDARSHFVTLAGVLAKNTPSGIMDQIRETYNLKNQPVVTQYAQEQP